MANKTNVSMVGVEVTAVPGPFGEVLYQVESNNAWQDALFFGDLVGIPRHHWTRQQKHTSYRSVGELAGMVRDFAYMRSEAKRLGVTEAGVWERLDEVAQDFLLEQGCAVGEVPCWLHMLDIETADISCRALMEAWEYDKWRAARYGWLVANTPHGASLAERLSVTPADEYGCR